MAKSSIRAAFLRYGKRRLKSGQRSPLAPSWRMGRGCRKFTASALAKGAKIEFREHGHLGKRIASRIAEDHLCRNPNYYKKER